MDITFYSKNWSVVKELTIENNVIPRVGETIIFGEDISACTQDQDAFLVHDVTYRLEDKKLTPMVKCHVFSNPVNRNELLVENGWLHEK